jgi:2-C-methyl-D-erythritol 4-phosphate cytidylyltransferase
MIYGLIVAAGSGERARQVDCTIKKQFIEIAGCPVIIHTLKAFQASPVIDTIVCVVAKEDVLFFEALLKRYPIPKVKKVIEGGACRQDSVAEGLSFLEKEGSANDIVVVHDGVRPLVSAGLVEQVVNAAKIEGSAVAALPVTDSLKKVSPDRLIYESIHRESVWAMQTPQAARLGLLVTAMKKAMAEGFVGTDEATLLERIGVPIICVEGSHTNIKITTASDLKRAEMLISGGL